MTQKQLRKWKAQFAPRVDYIFEEGARLVSVYWPSGPVYRCEHTEIMGTPNGTEYRTFMHREDTGDTRYPQCHSSHELIRLPLPTSCGT